MDDRTRPWKKLRVIVEVTVPPSSRATEKDLVYAVREALPMQVALPRPIHADAYRATTRIKAFTPFWPMFLRIEKGIRHFPGKRKKESE